jgi:hypothetical protein
LTLPLIIRGYLKELRGLNGAGKKPLRQTDNDPSGSSRGAKQGLYGTVEAVPLTKKRLFSAF